jgi:hypothetical protein
MLKHYYESEFFIDKISRNIFLLSVSEIFDICNNSLLIVACYFDDRNKAIKSIVDLRKAIIKFFPMLFSISAEAIRKIISHFKILILKSEQSNMVTFLLIILIILSFYQTKAQMVYNMHIYRVIKLTKSR